MPSQGNQFERTLIFTVLADKPLTPDRGFSRGDRLQLSLSVPSELSKKPSAAFILSTRSKASGWERRGWLTINMLEQFLAAVNNPADPDPHNDHFIVVFDESDPEKTAEGIDPDGSFTRPCAVTIPLRLAPHGDTKTILEEACPIKSRQLLRDFLMDALAQLKPSSNVAPAYNLNPAP